MKVFKILFLGGLLFTVFTQCDQLTEPTGEEKIPVVEGYLYSNQTTHQVQLSLMIPLTSTDTIPEPINDAEVVLIHNDATYPFSLAPGDSGLYQYTEDDLIIQEGETYALEIQTNNRTLSSETVVPPAPENVSISDDVVSIDSEQPFIEIVQNLPEPEITWNNPEERYFYIVVENLENQPEPIISNENAPGFNGGLFAGNVSFRTTPTNDDSYTINLRGGFYGLHKATIYSVNRDYVNLYEEREQDSRQLNEPPTNIKNGLGIFTSFSSDSIFFRVLKN
ncbi:MAG: DUF4249 family protein [Gracilimonas sp.]|nr:DUF4249 family protein [Gracilimonas sp.]